MTDEQPEPWARDLFWTAINAGGHGDYDAAALTIQRDFAEREAELVGALRAAIGAMEDDSGLDEAICCSGHDYGDWE